MANAITLTVNGVNKTVTPTSSGMPLLWVIRDLIGLTGTKYGCGVEICGACTVLINGVPHRACQTSVGGLAGKQILTVEGLANDPDGQKAQAAWIAHQVPQCGYCQSGMLMSIVGEMKSGKHGSALTSELLNVCACGTYQRIRQAALTL